MRNNFNFHICVHNLSEELVISIAFHKVDSCVCIAPNEPLDYLFDNFLSNTVKLILMELALVDLSKCNINGSMRVCSYANYSKNSMATPLRYDLSQYMDCPSLVRSILESFYE